MTLLGIKIIRSGLYQQLAQKYAELLAPFAIGDYGECDLDANDNQLTVKGCFKAAGTRHNVSLVFHRIRGSSLQFQGVEVREVACIS